MGTPVFDSRIRNLYANLAADYDVEILAGLPIINNILIVFSLHDFERWH